MERCDPAVGLRYDAIVRMLDCTDPRTLLYIAVEASLAQVCSRTGGAVYLLQSDGRLRAAVASGHDPEMIERFRLIPQDSSLPVSRSVREGRTVQYAAADYLDEFPDTPAFHDPNLHFIALPLLVENRCLGSLVVRLEDPEKLSDTRRVGLETVVAVCAHRLDSLLIRQETAMGTGYAPSERLARMQEGETRAARLELAMSSGQTGSFDWDFSNGRIVWDERLCQLFGVRPEEFDSKIESFYAAVHPEDREAVERAVGESRRTGDFHATYRVIRPIGTVCWIDARGRVLKDDTGRPSRMVGVANDITEQRLKEEREHRRKNSALRVTRALSDALTVRDVVGAMTRVVLPELGADALSLYLVDFDRLTLAGVVGYPEQDVKRLRGMDNPRRGPVAGALRENRPLFVESRPAFVEAFPDMEWEPTAGHHAWIVLPLVAAHRTVGSCSIAFSTPRRFSDEDRTLATVVAGILTQSLERARLYDRGRRQMTELQRVMLPRRLPEIPGLAVAARYLPATEGLDVGGDWYDALLLPGGKVGLVIGDVQGHNAPAAAIMGQLRTALRAYGTEGHDPGTLMSRMNHLMCGMDTELFATCCYAELETESGSLRTARAGHPYPLLRDQFGQVHELEVPGGPPLGLYPDVEYPVDLAVLQPGATLLYYTDGLVERAGHDYAEEVAALSGRLGRWAGTAAGKDLMGLADRVVGLAEAAADRDDDIAILLVRKMAGAGPVRGSRESEYARWQVTDGDLGAVARARRGLGTQVRAWGLDDRAGEVELLAAELLSNAALHTDGDVELTARLEAGALRVEVLDHSHHRPRLVPEGGGLSGRGMRLVDAHADRWGWEPRGERKAVWFEINVGPLPGPRPDS